MLQPFFDRTTILYLLFYTKVFLYIYLIYPVLLLLLYLNVLFITE